MSTQAKKLQKQIMNLVRDLNEEGYQIDIDETQTKSTILKTDVIHYLIDEMED